MEHLDELIKEYTAQQRINSVSRFEKWSGTLLMLAMIAMLYGAVLYETYHVHWTLAVAPAAFIGLLSFVADIAAHVTSKE